MKKYLIVNGDSKWVKVFYEHTDIDGRSAWASLLGDQWVIENNHMAKNFTNAQVFLLIKAAVEGRLEWRTENAKKEPR